MATPKPGQIRCPTCHQSTPPAAYCTQCGSPVPERARARPRGLDREELQSRIRARRSGLPPHRRGAPFVAAEPYEPEPEDARAVRPDEGGRPLPPVVDYSTLDEEPRLRRGSFVEEDRGVVAAPDHEEHDATRDWSEERAAPPPPAAYPVPALHEADEVYVHDDYEQYDYAADEAYEPYEEGRRGGSGLLAVVGFLALGGLALLGGALLWGVMSGDDDDVAFNTPSPTPTVEATPTPAPPATPTSTPGQTPDPGGDDRPATVVFEDGFQAEAQPCVGAPDLEQHAEGCDSIGSTNDGSLWVWVGFERGTDADVLHLRIFDEDEEQVAESDARSLSVINCGERCNGWTYFTVSGLPSGEYRVEVTRNGEYATRTAFTVRS